MKLCFSEDFLVGAPRFELGTPSPPDWGASFNPAGKLIDGAFFLPVKISSDKADFATRRVEPLKSVGESSDSNESRK
jgi:hypothetical protein